MQRQRPVESDEHSSECPSPVWVPLMGMPTTMAKGKPEWDFTGNLDEYLADWPDN